MIHFNSWRAAALAASIATGSLAFVAPSESLAQQTTRREISVEVGEQTSISAEGVRSYSEGAPGFVDVRLTEAQDRFILVGMSPGSTSLLLIMEDGSQVQYRVEVPSHEGEPVRDGAVPARTMVRLDLYFVQLSDSYQHAIGINFPGSIMGGQNGNATAGLNLEWANGGGGVQTQLVANLASALPTIDIAQASGWARIFRQGSVITANNTEANFRSGFEVNIVIGGLGGGSLETIEFGTTLQCLPRYDEETGRVELRITTEVTDIIEGEQAPGRSISTATSIVNLELGQGVVLMGNVARNESRGRQGLPGLSQIPILGALFGSHTRRFAESETLMFIVPTIVQPTSMARRNRIQEAIEIYEEFTGGVDEVELHDQPTIPGARMRTQSADDDE